MNTIHDVQLTAAAIAVYQLLNPDETRDADALLEARANTIAAIKERISRNLDIETLPTLPLQRPNASEEDQAVLAGLDRLPTPADDGRRTYRTLYEEILRDAVRADPDTLAGYLTFILYEYMAIARDMAAELGLDLSQENEYGPIAVITPTR